MVGREGKGRELGGGERWWNEERDREGRELELGRGDG